jgi:hypothetical protein
MKGNNIPGLILSPGKSKETSIVESIFSNVQGTKVITKSFAATEVFAMKIHKYGGAAAAQGKSKRK